MEKVIFDLIGVITKEKYFATKTLYSEIYKRISYNEFKKRYILYCVGMITNVEFWDGVFKEREIEEFEKDFFRNKIELNKNIVSFVKKLKDQGYVLYIASEIPSKWGNEILKNAGILHLFEKTFYSSSMKHTKPFIKFYNKVFNNINVKGGVVFFIDDTIHNLTAAKKHFPYVKTVLYKGNDLDGRVDYTVKSFHDLKKILYVNN